MKLWDKSRSRFGRYRRLVRWECAETRVDIGRRRLRRQTDKIIIQLQSGSSRQAFAGRELSAKMRELRVVEDRQPL